MLKNIKNFLFSKLYKRLKYNMIIKRDHLFNINRLPQEVFDVTTYT